MNGVNRYAFFAPCNTKVQFLDQYLREKLWWKNRTIFLGALQRYLQYKSEYCRHIFSKAILLGRENMPKGCRVDAKLEV